jgi:hypothetical protein
VLRTDLPLDDILPEANMLISPRVPASSAHWPRRLDRLQSKLRSIFSLDHDMGVACVTEQGGDGHWRMGTRGGGVEINK